ncbi:MAG: deoxyhypusine synthase family protein [Planctomycetota bacterium]
MELHYRHFNARETLAAAQCYKTMIESGGKMLLAMAGAMSTAELGISLAELIRQDKVHAISCTAANLEEDVFNLVAHNDYRICSNYRDLSPADETELRESGMNRVTDTCIPEDVIRHIEGCFMDECQRLAKKKQSLFPYEIFYRLFEQELLHPHFQIPIEHSWLYAAYEKQIPVFSPGFEDSTLGNIFTARVIEKKIASHSAIKSGTEQMEKLVNWYLENDAIAPIGFFQIGGGIAGDFAICSVPLILQDLEKDVRYWQYFAQISDSTTSYGSYSGAVPNEKITWHKLDAEAPKFMINSDASIVAPLIFSYVLGQ